MIRLDRSLLLTGILFLTLIAWAGVAFSLPPDDAGAKGVLVLRSGRVLQGEITPLGDRYRVKLGPGNEIRIGAGEVEFQAASLSEAYERKRVQLPTDGLGPRLDLVEWCLRYELLSQAATELAVALQLEPQNPRVKHLDRRLQATRIEPSEGGASSSVPAATAPRWDDLEREYRELPTGAVERFTATIQPLLINRCAANSCHGPNSTSSYHLVRPGLGNTANRRFTLRNLHATLAFVDKQEPDDSRLLKSLREAHGPNETKVFAANEQLQLELLSAWVRMASRPKTMIAPASISTGGSQSAHASHLPQRMNGIEANAAESEFQEPVAAEAAIAKPARAVPAAGGAGASAAGAGGSGAAKSTTAKSATAKSTATNPAPAAETDPFDPEIFNRKFLTQPSKSP
ncbi:MAG: hypothetical protein ACKPEY_09605 [Planctomycetota bacterium]